MSDKTDPAPPLTLKAQILDYVSEAMGHADKARNHWDTANVFQCLPELIAMGRRLGDAITLLAERELP